MGLASHASPVGTFQTMIERYIPDFILSETGFQKSLYLNINKSCMMKALCSILFCALFRI